MGFFNNWAQKEGPGVPKDAPKKRGLFLFFEIIGRKYSQLIGLNFLYFLCSLPLAVIYFLLSSLIVPYFVDMSMENYQFHIAALSGYITVFLLMTLGGGPFTAGFCYVIRNFSREEHAFVASDFFEHTKKNLKQSLVITFIDILLIFLYFINIGFYNNFNDLSPLIEFAAKALMTIFAVIYLISRMYLYSLMVTFDAKLSALYKFSYILAMLKLPQNMLLLLANIAVFLLAAMTPPGFFLFFVSPIFLLSLTYLAQSMYTTAVIKENIYFDDDEKKNKSDRIFND